MMKDKGLLTLLDFAQDVAKRSGRMIAKRREKPNEVMRKGEHDFVTEADYESQNLIVSLIRSEFPDHGFVAEERANLPGPKRFTWIIDPIDGTTNYIRNRSPYCVSIALVIDDLPAIGVIFEPVKNELFSAASGCGFYIDGCLRDTHEPAQTLHDAAVAIDWDDAKSNRMRDVDCIRRLIPHVQTIPVIGSVALSLAWLAAGRIDGYIKFSAKPWDVAAGCVMIRETGGQVAHLDRSDWDWKSSDNSVLASSRLIHDQLRACL